MLDEHEIKTVISRAEIPSILLNSPQEGSHNRGEAGRQLLNSDPGVLVMDL